MAVHLFDQLIAGAPQESLLLKKVTVRLMKDSERARFDMELQTKHYLNNPTVVGRVLRYVAEYNGQWVGLLVFSSPAYHIKLRDQWLHWSPQQVKQRRHLIVQNSRFLVVAAPGKWPNLASRILKLVCQRLPQDWQERFGYRVQVAETFVDPERFRGTCYKAAGWQQLGPTAGYRRDWRDFYTDTQHPKQIWVKVLEKGGLERVRAEQLPPQLLDPQNPAPPPCPVATKHLGPLWECFNKRLTDPRDRRGVRHRLASILTIVALAYAAGCQGPHAVWVFGKNLTHPQRRQLRLRECRNQPRKYEMPSERTFRRVLKLVNPDKLKDVLNEWMKAQDDDNSVLAHADGKTLRNAQPAPPRTPEQRLAEESQGPSEIPQQLQKPKADRALCLVNIQTTKQRLIDQVAVPSDTNEEAALAAHLPKMDLAGYCLTADAAHLTKANCRQLTQFNGADFLMFLKSNQPFALAKAEQLLPKSFPPSGHHC